MLWGGVSELYLSQVIHRLIIEPCADDVKRSHEQNDHHTADHPSTERHQPAIGGEYLHADRQAERERKREC